MTKKERAGIRQATGESVTGLTPDNMNEAVERLCAIVIPNAEAAPNRAGLRVSRDIVHEVASTLAKRVRNREKLDLLVDMLWKTGLPEARALAAYGIAPILPAEDEEGELQKVQRIRSYLLESKSKGVGEALAVTVSREVEGGRGATWMQTVTAWTGESDPRLRSFGADMYAHLFGRGESPEKLFDALKVAGKLMGDSDPAVQGSVRNLLMSSTRKHSPAIGRFLTKYDEDERLEVQKLVREIQKKVEERRKEIQLEL